MKSFSLHTIKQKLVDRYRWHSRQIIDAVITFCCRQPKVLSIQETIDRVLQHRLSVSRFGDGEMILMCGGSLNFQKYNELLAEKMMSAITSENPDLLVCIPNCFTKKSRTALCESDRRFWKTHLMYYRRKWLKLLRKENTYGNALMSRIYSCNWDINEANMLFSKIERLWVNRDIIIIEGAHSRLGVGNDCFKKAKSIQRILASATNSFDKYDLILANALEVAKKDTLFVLALGPSATAMAAELTTAGHQALDLGHIDIEYEWMQMGCKSKLPIPGKYSNEAFLTGKSLFEMSGQLSAKAFATYQSQIIADFSS